MAGRIVLFGATGFTGDLTARAQRGSVDGFALEPLGRGAAEAGLARV
jgi:hypothetical protein